MNLNNLALAYQLEKDSRAQEMGERALKTTPTNPEIKDTLGWILIEKGADLRGSALLVRASAPRPANDEIRLHLAEALLRSGNKVGARREFEFPVSSKLIAVGVQARQRLKNL